MIELHANKSDEVYKELATTGRYFNTGKVLIGVSCEPRPRPLSHSEELIQGALLGRNGPRITAGTWGYIALLGGIAIALYMVSVS